MPIISNAKLPGSALRSARKSTGLTQPQSALAAGARVRFIVDPEAGKPTVRLESVLKVMHASGGDLSLHTGAKESGN